ncbi:magnesium transporter [Schlesneria paludicola]|uniref:magnesium transporter n=1 Tax=Schlesneria paludicola TaxID=360056 RepID=UPI000299DAE4|nr:magnesium transporter [Schlesneria paludicola]
MTNEPTSPLPSPDRPLNSPSDVPASGGGPVRKASITTTEQTVEVRGATAEVTPADVMSAEVGTAPVLPSALRDPLFVTSTGSVRDILNDPVTQHMNAFAPLLRDDQSVGASLELIRDSQIPGRVIYFYVVDGEGRLKGVVSTRKLLFTSPQTKIAEIMATQVLSIPSTATVLEACERFTVHKLLAFPVVDDNQKILGVIDIDLYTDEIQEIDRRHDSEDLFQLIGVHLTEAQKGNAGQAFMGRFPWLLCNVAGGMLSAFIADAYQDVSTLAVVAPFISLVTALAESVSIQSVSLAIQSLHSQPSQWSMFARRVGLELLVGLFLGAASGLTVALVAFAWKGSVLVALSLFLGIAGGVVASAGIGLSMPYLLKLCRLDPQLASGPIALTLSDIVTLFCYFNLGRMLLGGF